MGIKNLSKSIKSKAPDSVYEARLYNFRGQKAAIDISSYLYRGLYNVDFNQGGHLMYIFNQVVHLIWNGITPIYVFDGSPPEEKDSVIQVRINTKHKNESKAQDLKKEGKIEEAKKVSKNVIRVRQTHINDVKKLLRSLGIRYIQADTEAEIVCARLYRSGKVNFCIGVDLDLLPFGAGIMVTNMNNSNTKVIVYDLKKILNGFNFTRKQFIEYCILCGCDYSGKVKGIGPANAYILLSKHGRIRNIPGCDRFKCKKVRRIFLDKDYPTDFNMSKKRDRNIKKVESIMCKTSIKPNVFQKKIKRIN